MAGIVRLDKIHSVKAGHLFDVVADEELQNGFIGVLGDLASDDDRELRKLEKPQRLEEGQYVLVASPEINHDQYKKTDDALEKFVIPAGTATRVYTLVEGDIYSVSSDLVKPRTGKTCTVGKYVTPIVDAYTYEEKDDAGTSKLALKIEAIEKIGRGVVIGEAGSVGRATEFVVMKVVRN